MQEMQDGDIIHGVTISKGLLQKNSLLIATPMASGNCTGIYAASLAKLVYALGEWKIPFSYLYYENESLVPRARNEMAIEFLNSGHTHLLFLDADIGFEAGNILVMLAHDKEFIAAPYPLKRINWDKVNKAAGQNSDEELQKIGSSDFVVNYLSKDFNPDRVTLVSDVGTGCLLLHRNVFSKMIYKYRTLRYKPMLGKPNYNGWGYSFFDCGIDDNGYYQPEDYTFCQRWRKLGGDIWLCPWMTLTHRGTINFIGNIKYAFIDGSKYNVKEKSCQLTDVQLTSK